MSYVQDRRREAAMALAKQGLSRVVIAERLGMAKSSVVRLLADTDAPRARHGMDRFGLRERHDELVALWASGVSVTVMAQKTGATRNALIGYTHRNRAAFPPRLSAPSLSGKPLTGAPKVVRERRPAKIARIPRVSAPSKLAKPLTGTCFSAPPLSGEPLAGAPIIQRLQGKGGDALLRSLFQLSGACQADDSPREGVALADLKHGCCRWAVNASESGLGHRFCGEPAPNGKPYCTDHEAFAYTTQAEAMENVRRYKERKQAEMRNARMAITRRFQAGA